MALLLIAALADLTGVIFKRLFFTQMAFLLFVLAALGATATAVSGNAAEANLLSLEALSSQVSGEMKSHTSWGNILIWVILAVAGGRGFAFLEKKPWATEGWLFPVPTSLLAIAVVYTGWLGGRLSAAIFDHLTTLI